MNIVQVFALGVIAIVVSGCGTAQPVLLNGSPEGVVVRYSQTRSTADEAVAAAEQFCKQYGRRAEQTSANIDTGDTYVSYSCEKR